ncbi:hypothetical protein Cflav_PD4676 [Pedosphaera parvula Ellin514]|uniref:Uncharacterized protein n=1 Tax=Pedosphaera parvula (strain Ellin514) TaxID=320771 RepID=B9XEC2_PEDPL|nr:hypothetical protein Cflav_PD4676 [Pedosphaera parvula Ellin514]
MLTAHGGLKRCSQGGVLQPEVQEAGTGNLDLFTDIIYIQFGQNVGGELARVHFPLLGQTHEGVALVIAELGIRTGANQDAGDIRTGQNRGDCLLQTRFYGFMGQHRVVTSPIN